LYGACTLAGGLACRAPGLTVDPAAEHVANWADGTLLVSAMDVTPGVNRVVGLNAVPYSTATSADGYAGIDWVNVVAQSILFAGGYEKPAGTCVNDEFTQDLNANGIDASKESIPDPADPSCAADIFGSNDMYYDHLSYGCAAPTHEGHDVDACDYNLAEWGPGDLLIGLDVLAGIGVIQAPEPALNTGQLDYDNCLYQYNPDQADMDCDTLGDVCDLCPLIPDDGLNGCPPTFNDGDCFGNACDNCDCVFNPGQEDSDSDTVGDACDNCPTVFNSDQADSDTCDDGYPDFWGDACDNCPTVCNRGQGDRDFDGVGDLCDNCLDTVNPGQEDADLDGVGDACDKCPLLPDGPPDGVDIDDFVQPDEDRDGVGDECDNCPTIENFDQIDADADDRGDLCDNCVLTPNSTQDDRDGDLVGDSCDVCPLLKDPGQEDMDEDMVGDVCDNCLDAANTEQVDLDGDGEGDVCDLCPEIATAVNVDSDADGVGDPCDNCPRLPNPDQKDADGDNVGDECDLYAIRGGGQLSEGCDSTAGRAGGLAWLATFALLALRRRRREVL
jgi:MYXO-CTERM domain-containing protein